MSFGNSGTFKDTTGHYYYEKKKKRDRLAGSVTTAGTAVTLTGNYYTTGPFIAETIWACNGETECEYFQILDGTTALTCRVYLAPSACLAMVPNVNVNIPSPSNFWNSGLIWMPFFTSVNINASSTEIVVAIGGWIP